MEVEEPGPHDIIDKETPSDESYSFFLACIKGPHLLLCVSTEITMTISTMASSITNLMLERVGE